MTRADFITYEHIGAATADCGIAAFNLTGELFYFPMLTLTTYVLYGSNTVHRCVDVPQSI